MSRKRTARTIATIEREWVIAGLTGLCVNPAALAFQ